MPYFFLFPKNDFRDIDPVKDRNLMLSEPHTTIASLNKKVAQIKAADRDKHTYRNMVIFSGELFDGSDAVPYSPIYR